MDYQLADIQEQDGSWGDIQPNIDPAETLRIVFQNTNGLHSSSPLTELTFEALAEMNCGFFGVAETNINSHNKNVKYNFQQTLSKAWPLHRAVFSAGDHGTFPEHVGNEYLPGGAAAWISNDFTSRVVDVGVDPGFGRWTHTTMQGKQGEFLTILPAYRTCKPGPEPGPLTSHMQQSTVLALKNLAHKIANPRSTRELTTEPRSAFIQDLIIEANKFISLGHKLIILLDANETWAEATLKGGKIRPDSIRDLIESCDLTDVFQQRFGSAAPTTTKFENRPIDMILTHGLQIQHAGILAADSPSDSDHLALWCDLDIATTFGTSASPMATMPCRRLTSKNEQTTSNYMAEISKQFTYHRIESRCQALLKIVLETNSLTPSQQATFFKLDAQVTQIMLRAEKLCSKKSPRKSRWTPEFKKAGQTVSYWERRCHQENYKCDKYIRKLGDRCGISPEVHDRAFTEISCKSERAKARGIFTQMKKHQTKLRDDFLDKQADTLAGGDSRKKATAVRAIKAGEKLQRDFKIIKHALGKSHKGLGQLETHDALGQPVTLTEKQELQQTLLTYNAAHFQQSNETPCGSRGPARSLFDPDNPSNSIEAILAGEEVTWDGISPDSALWMGELGIITDTIIDTTITEAQYIKHFKGHAERTISSPSGLHLGHDITAAKAADGCLRRVRSTICHIAIKAACPLPRWLHITQVILEKGKGPKLGSLRIIQLAEADLNFALKAIWSHGLIGNATKENLLDPAQYALPGKQCNSAVLAKVLFLDICHQTRTDCSFAETDAKACFDRVIPLLAIVTCRRLGLPAAAATFMNDLLRQLTFKLRTAHGLSDQSYRANDDILNPGNGSGQGLSFSPPLWLTTSDPLLRAMRRKFPGVDLSHPGLKALKAWLLITMFMDDATMYAKQYGRRLNHFEPVISQHMQTLPSILAEVLQCFNGLLWMTGGRLCIEKCMWYYISWKKGPKDTCIPKTEKECPGDIRILEELECGKQGPQNFIQIPRKAPRDPHRTLGVIISPDGSRKAQLNIQIAKARTWNTLINSNKLYGDTKWLAYRAVLTPALFYPLPLHCFLETELAKLDRQVSTTAKNSLGLPRSYPSALFAGPAKYGGIASYSSYARAGAAKLDLFLRHARSSDEGGKLLHVSLGHSQLQLGKGTALFDLDFDTHGASLTPTWLTHLWHFLCKIGCRLTPSKPQWIPSLQRVADQYIMELADVIYPGRSKLLDILKKCRCYLQVVTLADIVSSDGTHITNDSYNGVIQHGRPSRYDWPETLFKPSGWRLWQAFLHELAPYRKLTEPLGPWIIGAESSSQDWRFRVDSKDTLYLWDDIAARPFPVDKVSRGSSNVYYGARLSTSMAHDPPSIEEWNAWDRADVLEGSFASKNRLYLTHWTPYSSTIIDDLAPDPVFSLFDTTLLDPQGIHHPMFLSIQKLSAEARRRVGDVILPSSSDMDEVTAAITNSTAICVCDGSMKHRRGSHAWILSSTDTYVKLEGAGPSDGNPTTMTSYRPELQGLVALLSIIQVLTDTYRILSGSITIACDNISAVHKVEDMISFPALYIIPPTAKEYDLLIVIRDLLISIPVTMIPVHVKGHKDKTTAWKDLTYPEQLNIECDRNAKAWLAANEGTEKSPQPTACVFESERWAVIQGETKLTSNIKDTVLQAYHGAATEKYVKDKYKWPTDAFAKIDWPAIDLSLAKLPSPQKVKHSKLMHSWLPVGTRTARYEKSTANICPLCNLVPETQDHIFCCQNEDAVKHRTSAWTQCLETIRVTGKTNRHILDAFDSHGSQFLQLPPRPILYISLTLPELLRPNFETAVADQESIGWNFIFRGIIASAWGKLQAQYIQYIEKPKSRWTLGTWQRKIVTALLTFGHALWRHRNDTKFGKDKQTAAQKLRRTLEHRVTAHYQDRPYLLTKFVHLFNKPLEVRLRQGNRTLKAWLRHLGSYATISDHAASNEGRQRDFRSYLPSQSGLTPPRYLDVAAERALRRHKRRQCPLPKVIRKTRAMRKKKYPPPDPNAANHIKHRFSRRGHFSAVSQPLGCTADSLHPQDIGPVAEVRTGIG